MISGTSLTRRVSINLGLCAVYVASHHASPLGGRHGRNKKASADKGDDVVVVPVSHPAKDTVTDFADFTGQTNSMKPTNIIARVTGYVDKTPFKEGSEVKTGDLLYVIDPQPYEAQLEQAKKQKELDDAQLDLAKKTLARDAYLEKRSTARSASSKLTRTRRRSRRPRPSWTHRSAPSSFTS